jgi:hypothetical protein
LDISWFILQAITRRNPMPRLPKEVQAYLDKEKEVVRLQNELAALQRETEHFKQYGTFHEEVKLEMGRTRVMTLVIAGVLVAGAVIAFFSWNKKLDDARQNMEKTNREIANRVFGLERGFFLYQHDFYQDAIPYLKTAYEQYPRDETVVVEYLDSLDREGELDEALAVIQTLRSERLFQPGGLYPFREGPDQPGRIG